MILQNICNKLLFNKKSNEQMGRGSIRTSFQRHTYGQQVHEKAHNIINHQGNIDKNQEEIPPDTYQNGYY